MQRWLRLTKQLTSLSCAKQQRMAAVVVKGGAILGMGVNRHGNCAERRAIRPHRNYSGATIYIMRHNGRCSRPCNDCQRLIVAAGITRSVYVAADGTTVAQETFK